MRNPHEEFEIVVGHNKRKKPILGTKYGDWIIISENIAVRKSNKQHTYWHSECKCGFQKFVRSSDLTRGLSTRCRNCGNRANFFKNVELGKMSTKGYSPKHQGVGDLPKLIYTHFKRGAKSREIEFFVTIEYLWKIFLEQNKVCNISGVEIYFRKNKTAPITKFKEGNRQLDYTTFNASLDRIDSTKGYTIGNVQWVHRDINMSKHTMNNESFIQMCKVVANNNKKYKNE